MASALVLLALLGQYPPEAQPIRPTVVVLWMVLPLPLQDVPPDPTQTMRALLVFSPATASTQAQANAKCTDWMTNANGLNPVYSNDPAMVGRFELAGCRIATHYTPQGGVSQDLQWATHDATIAAWRTQVAADIVVMDSQYGDWCGMSWECAPQLGANYGFSAISDGCAIGNLSLVHEVGHLLCIDHDVPNDGATPFAYGHGFCDSAHGRRDPMVYPSPCGGGRVPYFGNPNISPFGYPFGDAVTADGARVIREQWAKVANLLPAPANHRPSSLTNLTALQ